MCIPRVPRCHTADFSLFPLELNTAFWFHHTHPACAPEKVHIHEIHGPALWSSRLGCPAPRWPARCLELHCKGFSQRQALVTHSVPGSHFIFGAVQVGFAGDTSGATGSLR